jgi:protein-S-isoprenylcysteine O-methyltransferase Ste14
MYLGMVVMMLGLGLASGVPFMAIAALSFVVIVTAVHIPHEEAQMQRTFGGWYSDYAASVRRWL